MTTWLLTGGAGYIGAHVCAALRAADRDVVVLDDLSTGMPDKLPSDVPLVEASVLDRDAVLAALREHEVAGVVHLAAKKAVNESVERPLWYWQQNVEGLRSLLDAVSEAGVESFAFSSSAAVYGEPDVDVVSEDTPCAPMSPYGTTKLAGEWLLRDLAPASGLRHTSLRYFNVAGAGAPELGDTGVFNLVPLVLRALARGDAPRIFGDDYPTPDGTCVRDYIHVADLARAHVDAALALERGRVAPVYNVSTGRGASVREVVAAVTAATGLDVEPVVTDARPGDPPRVVGSPERLGSDLGWRAEHDLHDMVTSAWQAWQANPPT